MFVRILDNAGKWVGMVLTKDGQADGARGDGVAIFVNGASSEYGPNEEVNGG